MERDYRPYENHSPAELARAGLRVIDEPLTVEDHVRFTGCTPCWPFVIGLVLACIIAGMVKAYLGDETHNGLSLAFVLIGTWVLGSLIRWIGASFGVKFD